MTYRDELPRCARPDGKPPKLGYASRAKANQARVKTQPVAGAKLSVYRCPRCGLWHITGRPRREGQGRRGGAA